jgi:hypothetical protein
MFREVFDLKSRSVNLELDVRASDLEDMHIARIDHTLHNIDMCPSLQGSRKLKVATNWSS